MDAGDDRLLGNAATNIRAMRDLAEHGPDGPGPAPAPAPAAPLREAGGDEPAPDSADLLAFPFAAPQAQDPWGALVERLQAQAATLADQLRPGARLDVAATAARIKSLAEAVRALRAATAEPDHDSHQCRLVVVRHLWDTMAPRLESEGRRDLLGALRTILRQYLVGMPYDS